jgi:tetratricopeptide (TPR) repeat protein
MASSNKQSKLEQLFSFDTPQDQRAFLEVNATQLEVEETARRLKAQADQYLRSNIQFSLQTSQLLARLSELSGSPRPRALAYLAEANARSIGLGEYDAALMLYDQAAEIFRAEGSPVEQAVSQIGKIGALVFLGRYQDALETGRAASQVLAQHKDWFSQAKVVGNLAIVHYRLGDDIAALQAFEHAQQLYARAGMQDSPGWLRAEFNRAIVLRNLGRFDDSIQASLNAQHRLEELDQPVEAARALQNLALTYFVLGRYNEALERLDQVRSAFLADGRHRDAILTELFISDCLLQLRRFPEVLEKSHQVYQVFDQLGTRFEVGLAIMNEAIAYAGLRRYDEALASLEGASKAFIAQGNPTWAAYANLEAAGVLLRKGQYRASLRIAEDCLAPLSAQPVKRAQACLAAARALLALDMEGQASEYILQALQVSEERDVPSIAYAAHAARGRIAEARGEPGEAAAAYEQAIGYLENLRGRLMIEFRADFLDDKQEVYEDMVALHVQQGKPDEALRFTERAKSRALFDLLAHRLDLRLAALDPDDRALAEELSRLRAERDRLYRRWESEANEEMRVRGDPHYEDAFRHVQSDVLEIEKRITGIWHKLLIRNAGYARQASIWQVRTEVVQPYLGKETLLLEYYFSRGELLLFLVDCQAVRVVRLSAELPKIMRLQQLLGLNWKAAASGMGLPVSDLERNARGILRQLYGLLLEAVREQLEAYSELIFVPHGNLHYLPFHALHNGERYLIETHSVSYLPAASLLRYCREVQPASQGALVVGDSYQGRLQYTLKEAELIASMWQARLLTGDQATRDAIQQAAPGCRLVHLASHGDFRSDNPLFSGLAFSDGAQPSGRTLTTLDIFNMRLNASLVTLSACQTGRSVIGGGDELLGLLRAFLYAGAQSLLLSQWAVDDRSTALLMEIFYQGLQSGASKGEALRRAQCAFLARAPQEQEQRSAAYAHPYYWAPFFLVGDPGMY